MADKDFYRTLGVARTATEKEVKAAYRKAARKYHPDVNPDNKDAESRFKEINAAYEVLSDADKRKKYDQFGANWEHGDQMNAQWERARPRGAGGPFGGAGHGGINLEDLLGNMFAGGQRGAGATRQRRGADTEHKTDITLEEAYNGTTRLLQVQSEERCAGCNGTGVLGRNPCATCGGTGMRLQQRRIEVKIPPGVRDGARVRFAGEGQAGIGGAPRGDLYLLVSIRAHDAFERDSDDLSADIDVPLATAVLGGEVKVRTLKGSHIAVRVQPETQNGQSIRLAGLGMPKYLDPTKHGDLYIRVHVLLPTHLTVEQQALFQTFAESLE